MASLGAFHFLRNSFSGLYEVKEVIPANQEKARELISCARALTCFQTQWMVTSFHSLERFYGSPKKLIICFKGKSDIFSSEAAFLFMF